MSTAHACPALFISAAASGQGKTTITAALARFHTRSGLRVRVFKTGPDFIDPMLLEQACGLPVYQLDLWMGGEQHCRQLLCGAAAEADLILIEGVMGLFDGQPSSADLAACFQVPVLAVIDASAMAQTFAAVAHGLASFRNDIQLTHVFANRVGSAGHATLLQHVLPDNLVFAGYFQRDDAIAVPERHLGLLQAGEIADLDQRLDAMADALENTALDTLPPSVIFAPTSSCETAGAPLMAPLRGMRIAVARDAACAFLYRANLDTLQALGAECMFFSPLAGECIPQADALYLPGGYPELHIEKLRKQQAFFNSLQVFHAQKKPIVAECGGMLLLLQTLTTIDGDCADMAGLLPGHAVMQKQLAALALQQLDFADGSVRGHSFHFSHAAIGLPATAHARCPNGGGTAEAFYRHDNITASYIHSYFPSNPDMIAQWFLSGTCS